MAPEPGHVPEADTDSVHPHLLGSKGFNFVTGQDFSNQRLVWRTEPNVESQQLEGAA